MKVVRLCARIWEMAPGKVDRYDEPSQTGRKLSLPVSDSFLDNNRPMPWSYRL